MVNLTRLIIVNFCVFCGLMLTTVLFTELSLQALGLHKPPLAKGDRTKYAIHDDAMGWRPKPMERGTFRGTAIAHNSFGFREREFQKQKEKGRERIIVLGDSFTWGFMVNSEDRYTDKIAQWLPPNLDLINMGCSGYGTDQELLFLKSDGLSLAPNLVVVSLHWDSDKRNNVWSTFYGYQKPLYTVADGKLTPYRNFPVPLLNRSSIRRWLDFNSHVWQIIRKNENVSRGVLNLISFISFSEHPQPYKSPASAVELTAAILSEMQMLAFRNGADFLVMVAPNVLKVSDGHQKIVDDPSLSELMGKLKGHKIRTLELQPIFEAFFSKYPDRNITFDNDRHWNEDGHALVAEALYNEVLDMGFITQ